MSSTATEYSAEETLERMLGIVARGRLQQGVYVEMGQEREPDAPCGGTNCCMIGAAWLANGVQFEVGEWNPGDEADLPGALPHCRAEFLATRPELKRALDALNRAAEERIDTLLGMGEHVGDCTGCLDLVEAFFESFYASHLPLADLDDEMTAVIKRAQELL